MRCIIVGSGPSANGFTPPDGITIIAVNGAIEWLERTDWWFTLDPSPINIERMSNRRSDVQYTAAVPEEFPLPDGVKRYLRHSYRGDEPKHKGSPEWLLWRYSAVKGLSTSQGVINTGNSAYGALGLAYHLGFKDVALIGVDATTDRHRNGEQSGPLGHLPVLFASTLDQINVVSCGMLQGIPKMTLEEWLQCT